MLSISVILTTFNEEPNIAAALDSVKNWAAEIIVVDSFSTDRTLEILKNYPSVKVFQRIYTGPSDQKNWAIPQAQNEWILLMDADERTTPKMREEIEQVIKPQQKGDGNAATHNSQLITHNSKDCYWIGFTHFFMGKKVRFSGWQNDKTIRLIRRDVCRYNDNQVHEEINTAGLNVGFLTSKFDHYTFRNLSHFIAKQERYARWSALDYDKKTGSITAFHWVVKPFFRFFKHFVLKLGFLDGRVGFVIAAVAAWAVFLRYAFMTENRRISDNG
jgi:glycosyltransferase involved in cell wall biosynthesis